MFQKNFLKLPFPSKSCQRVTVQVPFEKKDWVFHMDHDFGHLCFGQLLVLNILQALLLCPDFCCCHLWCWWSLFSEHCIRTRIIFYNVTSEYDPACVLLILMLQLRILEMTEIHQWRNMNFFARMPCFTDHFFLVSDLCQLPCRYFLKFFPFFLHSSLCVWNFLMLEAPEWICEQDCNES